MLLRSLFILTYRFRHTVRTDMDYISFENSLMNNSSVGKKGGEQRIRLSSDSFKEGMNKSRGKIKAIGVPMHELMHVLGKYKFRRTGEDPSYIYI